MSGLPRGWVESSVDEVGDISSGFGFPDRFQGNVTGELPFAKVRDISQAYQRNGGILSGAGNYVSRADLIALKARTVPAGSVAFAKIGEALKLNRRVLLDVEAVLDNNCMAVTPHQGLVEPKFLYRFLTTLDFAPFSVATTVPSIRKGDVGSIRLPLPPLAEQKRMVAKLDALNAKSARARTELARIETLVSRYKQAVLSKAFSGALTAHLRKPSGETIQATISDPFTHTQSAPASWTRHLFSEVCTIVGGSQPPKTTFAYAPQEGYIRLVQIRDYKSDAKATYIPNDLARRFCSSTDIMIGRYGPPIFQILRGIEGAYNVALMKAEPTEAVAQEFLYWYLHHPVLFKYVEIDSKRTAGQDGVNKAHLERWPILLPPLEEQHEIARRIESAFGKIDRLAKEAKRALELVGKLDEAILAKAFRGELVPQDENDEPAELLLARIRAEREAAPKGKRGRGAKG